MGRLLVSHFGVGELRPFQREAIDAVLEEGARVLLIAETGGGKSLCYQLPALLLEGTTLVVSPLVALMEDQVRGLFARGIPATYFASTLTAEENGKRLLALRQGAYRLVYVAPERLGSERLLRALREAKTSLVAIDEAHCIVQWGHDFRPDYLKIGEALERLGGGRILACTATATSSARFEIMRCLGFNPRETKLIVRGLVRPNLSLNARRASGTREVLEQIVRALHAALRGPGCAIVYTATRKAADRLGEELRLRGFDAPVYHAGTSPEERARISAEFAEQRTRVLVATNAFGMGIDRPDVRLVIHAQVPASLDAYYQEVGRAGRDGKPARGLLLLTRGDIGLRRRFSEHSTHSGARAREETARARARLSQLLRFVDANVCRQIGLRQYFGEDRASTSEPCGICDVCLGLTQSTQRTQHAVKPAPKPALRAHEEPEDDEAPDTIRDPPREREEEPPRREAKRELPVGVPRQTYEALCRYRAARARALGVPCYVVAPNRTLIEMAMLRPETKEELSRVHGMGKTRLSAHGEGFLRALRDLDTKAAVLRAEG